VLVWDSTAKSNSSELSFGIEEHFMGGAVSQHHSWPMIEPVRNEINLVISIAIESASFES